MKSLGSKVDQRPVAKSGKKQVDSSQNPSSSCPQLTIEEPTSTTSSIEEEDTRDQVKTSIDSLINDNTLHRTIFLARKSDLDYIS